MAQVAIVMGSNSDLPVVQGAIDQLKALGLILRLMLFQPTEHLSVLRNLLNQQKKTVLRL